MSQTRRKKKRERKKERFLGVQVLASACSAQDHDSAFSVNPMRSAATELLCGRKFGLWRPIYSYWKRGSEYSVKTTSSLRLLNGNIIAQNRLTQ